ncbi:MAG: Processing alpha glucosidase I [Cirrosporium novae-zelandiae]|nr:MAG: Processing alpha glucosidase I [Cirrosporium novae-zelandiae]
MAGYGWDEYDVRDGGRQTIHDSGNAIDLTIEYIKVPGGSHGGNWGTRVKGVPREDAPVNLITSVIFTTAMEGFGAIEFGNEIDELGYEGTVTFKGQTPELGGFKIDITEGPDSNEHPPKIHPSYDEKPVDRTMVASLQIPEEALWQTKNVLFQHLKQGIEGYYMPKYGQENAPPPYQVYTIANQPGPGNVHFVQKVFQGPFEFDILFSSESAPEPLNSEILTKGVKEVNEKFSERFKKALAPSSPFTKSNYDKFSKAMFSNLVGGIGYFYGDEIVDRSYALEYEEENEGFWEEAAEARSRAELKIEGPNELFTSIPSRPFFPRGFLWDEGFHLIPMVEYDIDLTLEIIKSWFNLMDDDGWIAREQILGPEARSKVPTEFRVQYPHYANPPTLFFVLETFIDKIEAASKDKSMYHDPIRSTHLINPSLGLSYLRNLYPLLKRHYFWFRKTQWGDLMSYDREAFSTKEAYRWRGRTPQHILPSGLDDYPRPQPPHPGELHTDLISWMGMMTRTMRRIATTLDEIDDSIEFTKYETAILHNIDDLHWDSDAQTYCDATIDDFEESVHVCHKGYISIFPFLTGLLDPDSPRLGAVLDLIGDPEELWSEYGIRSLSKKSEFYGTDENYWRSPIWININYLVVTNLYVSLRFHPPSLSNSSANLTLTHQKIATNPGPHRAHATDLYNRLRRNLVQTVYSEWERTGFAWEQYNPETGEGQRTQHFTGWTSLVVDIMRMPAVKGEEGKDEL